MEYITSFEVKEPNIKDDILISADIFEYIEHLKVGMEIEFLAKVIKPSVGTHSYETCTVHGKIDNITNRIVYLQVTNICKVIQRITVVADNSNIKSIQEAMVKLFNKIENKNDKDSTIQQG